MTATTVGACESVIYQYLHSNRKASRDQLFEALCKIEEFGTATSVFAVIQLSVDKDIVIRKQSWKTIETLLQGVPIEALSMIDEEMRSQGVKIETHFTNIDPSMPTKMLGLLSFNRSGYVRELAVKELSERFDGEEFSFLILRANDWVDLIQAIALRAVFKRTSPKYVLYLIRNLPLFHRLFESKRYDLSKLKERVEQALSDKTHTAEVGAFLNSRSRQLRRFVFKVCLANANVDPAGMDSIIQAGLSNTDVGVQLDAAKYAFKFLPTDKIDSLVSDLLAHHSPQIRRESLRWIVEQKRKEYEEHLTRGLFDVNSGVRDLVRYYLRDQNTALIYERNLLERTYPIEPTLRGIVETNGAASKDVISEFLEDKSGRVRGAGYAVLFRDNTENVSALVLRSLADNSGVCAREGLKYLGKGQHAVSAEELWKLLQTSPSLRVKKSMLIGISKLNKWESIRYLLLARSMAEPELQSRLDVFLNHWLDTQNNRYIKPTKLQIESCTEALKQNGALLSPTQRNSLEFAFKQQPLI